MDVIQLQRRFIDYTSSLYREALNTWQGFLDEQFTQLQQLQDESNPEFVVEVVSLFFEDADKILADLSKTLAQQPVDFKKVDAHIHQFKGSSSRYLLVLDRTNWRTNMLTSLLVPYIFLNLPSLIFNIFRGEIGKWIAFVAVVLRLFFPRHFPDWLEMPGSLILLLVVTPHLIVEIRGWWIGVIISLIIGAYLLQEHIRKNGGFRNAFAERRGVSNTIGIILLFISPLWELIKLVL